MSFSTRLEAKMEPWLTADLKRWLKAAAQPYEQVETLTEETGTFGKPGWIPPYAKVMNPTECPAAYLPWLGQFCGVQVRKTATEAEARAEVKAESGLSRGTRKSLETLLKKALGAKAFYILEREPTPYSFKVVIPVGGIPAAMYEEINLTKPAGLTYEVVERPGTWYVGTKKWSAVAAGKKWSTIVEGEY